MQLEELVISRNAYGFAMYGLEPGEVGGKIKFSGTGGGTVELVLKENQIKEILSVVADVMVSHAKELANELTAQIIESATNNVLESKS